MCLCFPISFSTNNQYFTLENSCFSYTLLPVFWHFLLRKTHFPEPFLAVFGNFCLGNGTFPDTFLPVFQRVNICNTALNHKYSQNIYTYILYITITTTTKEKEKLLLMMIHFLCRFYKTNATAYRPECHTPARQMPHFASAKVWRSTR